MSVARTAQVMRSLQGCDRVGWLLGDRCQKRKGFIVLLPAQARAKSAQSNRLETDFSRLVREIASPISVEIDMARILEADSTAPVG